MPGHRRPKHLTCFYCGRRTSTPYEKHIRQFTCPSCEATNYLDSNGEITDPPVATTAAEAVAIQYAVPGSTPPNASSRSADIFCKTCLEHQRLFTASLAQYLPEDPDSPDYAQAENDFFRFRRGLERRYPQICAECEPKVLERIRQAGYTARSDHLRRMIDQSRESRRAGQPTYLDVLDLVGRCTWYAGLVLQLLWHASNVQGALEEQSVVQKWPLQSRDILRLAGRVLGHLPSPEALIRYSILAAICSSWWNPRFVQTVRGFTRHITGLPSWYVYQAMVIVLRAVSTRISLLLHQQFQAHPGLVGAHLFMGVFMLYLYRLAQRSVRTDTAPLFGPASTQPIRTDDVLPAIGQSAGRDVSDDSMSRVLDEILQTPTPAARPGAAGRTLGPDNSRLSPATLLQPASPSNPYVNNRHQLGSGLGSLSLSEDAPGRHELVQPVSEVTDEMDWSPTHSQHRAFSSFGTNLRQTQGFGATPVEPRRGAFWFRVPPAPVPPAARRQRPAQPTIQQASPSSKEELHFGGALLDETATTHPTRGRLNGKTSPRAVDFAKPHFFATPEEPNDPRNTLSDLFGESFSLSSGPGDARGRPTSSRASGLQRGWPSSSLRKMEAVVLTLALLAWLHSQTTRHGFSIQVALAATAVCVLISARVTGETLRSLGAHRAGPASQATDGPRLSQSSGKATVLAVLGVLELGMAVALGLQVWRNGTNDDSGITSWDAGRGEVIARQAGWLIGLVITHQLASLVW